MPEWPAISIFVLATIVIVVMPGPNTIYIMTRSLQEGVAAGIVSSLGVMLGTVVHVMAAALGLSALLLSSAVAFNAVKYAGAAYLVYLGIKTLMTRENAMLQPQAQAPGNLRTTFYHGFVVNLLNPKTAMFFTAFLPQFIDSTRGSVPGQILFFGALLIGIGAVSDFTYSFLAGSSGRWLHRNVFFLGARRYVAGVVYLSLGAATALTGVARK
jgi:threonine/homoserine/homoserine lactone efflux protein